MGLYNEIYGKIKCPYCNKDVDINEQLKWPEFIPNLKHYTIGDKFSQYYSEDIVEPVTAIFDYATGVRPRLFAYCDNCEKVIPYEIEVKDNKIIDIRMTPKDKLDNEIHIANIKDIIFKKVEKYTKIKSDENRVVYYDATNEELYSTFKFLGVYIKDKKVDLSDFYLSMDRNEELLTQLKGNRYTKDWERYSKYNEKYPNFLFNKEYCEICKKKVQPRVIDEDIFCNICGQFIREKKSEEK